MTSGAHGVTYTANKPAVWLALHFRPELWSELKRLRSYLFDAAGVIADPSPEMVSTKGLGHEAR